MGNVLLLPTIQHRTRSERDLGREISRLRTTFKLKFGDVSNESQKFGNENLGVNSHNRRTLTGWLALDCTSQDI